MMRPSSVIAGGLIIPALFSCSNDGPKCVDTTVYPVATDYVVIIKQGYPSAQTIYGLRDKYRLTLDYSPDYDERVFAAMMTPSIANGMRCEPAVESMGYNAPIIPH